MDADPLVKVGWAHNQAEAELIAGMLREAGVESVVRRGIGVDVPDLIAAGPRDILVARSSEDVARELLEPAADAGPSGPATRPLWVRGLAVLIAGVLLATAAIGVVRAIIG